MSDRAAAIADRLEQGAKALAHLVRGLPQHHWTLPVPGDGRSVGVLVHHVATMYPIEVRLAAGMARGKSISGLTWAVIHEMNADHAKLFAAVTKAEALDLLVRNSDDAADSIRTFTDADLDQVAAVSLNADAPLTCQFFLEDHAVRHSYHHAQRIRQAIND